MKLLVVVLMFPILLVSALFGALFGVCMTGFVAGMVTIKELLEYVREELSKRI